MSSSPLSETGPLDMPHELRTYVFHCRACGSWLFGGALANPDALGADSSHCTCDDKASDIHVSWMIGGHVEQVTDAAPQRPTARSLSLPWWAYVLIGVLLSAVYQLMMSAT